MTSEQTPGERAEAVRSLEAEFSELISRIRKIITENAHRVSPGMLPGAYKVFTSIVRCEPVTQAALAEQLALDKGQLSRTVRELEELGLVTRTPDPADRRSSRLSATPEGLARLAAARAPQQGTLHAVLEDWDLDDIRNLTRLLRALTNGTPPG
ncbi:MarR family transcriptional regulator [Microbacterium sp. zg.Y625]|uniref:MarR family winged helix-turn-helix transcriptional regulator n=1 Tax=Microbacterium jiangjiandongii TaxID=3049071 RepID=UPI00214B7349|nr:MULTISPECIES: MarR family transcriptional regulator [unclassified Microbacterium]MCR2791955.1 MarR family transcriptional regulator [Microbacterium sp. zg.Y625]WIM24766.1 MarR family transcriptional regulator [Microbacterium sp. zg-Y625]